MAPVLAQHGLLARRASRLVRPCCGRVHSTASGLHIKVVNGVDEVVPTPNTVGILEGSDPELQDEYIVFSAHMDHVGTSAERRLSGSRGRRDLQWCR